MGYPWKMFTQTQGQELLDGTNHTWTTIKGVNGRKFTSKTDSSKYIFLPAGGKWQDSSLGNKGTGAAHWCTISTYPPYARYFMFTSNSVTTLSDIHRSIGMSVRAK